MKRLFIGGLALSTAVLVACNGSDSSTSSSEFPSSLALGSPTDVVAGDAAVAARATAPRTLLARLAEFVVPRAHAAAAKVPRYTWATLKIEALLDGTLSPADVFKPEKLLVQDTDASCYGPALAWQNHPDGTTPPSGTLPTGDLGIWLATDTDGSACAAAQLNKRMQGVSWRANMALMGLAALVAQMESSGIAAPTAGNTVDLKDTMNSAGLTGVTFTQATLGLDASGSTWTYVMDFSFEDGTGASHGAQIRLEHTPGTSDEQYNGILTYAVQDQFNGGNCPGSGARDVTRIGTLKYTRDSRTAMQVSLRSGTYCGHDSYSTLASFATDGQLDPADTWNAGTATGWADGFSRFGADYDPTTLKGDYLYAWQAGYLDGNSRMFLVRLDAAPVSGVGTGSGEAWFGFGDAITSSTVALQGMICNWAGPGNSHTPHDGAQRQGLQYDAATETWIQPAGDANLRYAPTNSCEYDGSGTFWYDRNLNGTVDEVATDLNVSPPDLWAKGPYATLEARIAASGYTKPSF